VRKRITPLALFLLLFAVGCAPDIAETDFFSQHPDPDELTGSDVILLDHSEAGTRLLLVSQGNLGWGFNAISIQESEGWTSLEPSLVFESATQVWRAPIESSIESSDDGDTAFVYAMPPPTEAGQWYLTVEGSTPAGQMALRVPVRVDEDIWMRPANDLDVIVAWLAPLAPRTGTDTFELGLYRLEGNDYRPITDATLDLYPYMDMGGGEGHSTPYSAPTHVGSGTYSGMVNFIMSGGWDMTVHITLAGETRDVLFHGFTVNGRGSR